mmetsp:Transcript_57703/g.160814  ORF Transcript_57703/g.160814 Transcript_57703/m.160814 type:complete len:233 (-) Transcript_57703:1162-1860(-)
MELDLLMQSVRRWHARVMLQRPPGERPVLLVILLRFPRRRKRHPHYLFRGFLPRLQQRCSMEWVSRRQAAVWNAQLTQWLRSLTIVSAPSQSRRQLRRLQILSQVRGKYHEEKLPHRRDPMMRPRAWPKQLLRRWLGAKCVQRVQKAPLQSIWQQLERTQARGRRREEKLPRRRASKKQPRAWPMQHFRRLRTARCGHHVQEAPLRSIWQQCKKRRRRTWRPTMQPATALTI